MRVARSGADSRVSLIAARHRALHGRATLVRPRCLGRRAAGTTVRFLGARTIVDE